MADDMKVSVDITADLSKLESSLNTAYEKTRAAGAKMQSALNIQAGASGMSTGPGSATVAPAFNSNQIAFGNALNVQRGANFGYGQPIGPMPASNTRRAVPVQRGGFTEFINDIEGIVNAGSFLTAAKAADDTFRNAPFALANAKSDPVLAGQRLSQMGRGLTHSNPASGVFMDAMDFATGINAQSIASFGTDMRQMRAREAAAEGMGGYFSQQATMKARHTQEMLDLRKNKAFIDPLFNRRRDALRDAQKAERSNLDFERRWDLKSLDVQAGAETLRMFGSDFAADQMTIGANFDRQIEMANRAKDSARASRLTRLKEVSLLSSAMKNVGVGAEMSMQGTALGGVRPGQFNPNDPVVLKVLDRIAAAVEDNAGGVPLAR